jgi:nitrile hydratase subunit alpha
MANKNHRAPLSDTQLRVKALESVLLEKGLVDQATMDAIIDNYENKVGPHNGARLVARAWTDPEFKAQLLKDGSGTIAELGLAGIEGTHIEVKENTADVHNMVVCTLCSCYPWTILGLPPTWYKSTPYRARAVRDPRGILKEFGVEMSEDVEVRVWDSNAELRYLVLPMRPEGSENLTEDELAALVTRDSMIGTSVVEAIN